jgi:poly(3-hydroxybutyrate) depolymerase
VNGAFAAMQGGGKAVVRTDALPMRTIVFHGSADKTVAPVNADAVLASALGRARATEVEDRSVTGASVTVFQDADGTTLAEKWSLGGVAHAWSGGTAEGSHTDPAGPDASREMVRFFLASAREVTA